jgi:hypothetical protein
MPGESKPTILPSPIATVASLTRPPATTVPPSISVSIRLPIFATPP